MDLETGIMTNCIAILGATGVYARHLIPRLIQRGHAVRALVRRPEAASVARACGAQIQVADIFDHGSLQQGFHGCDTVINLATSLPGPSGRGDFEANDRLRRDGSRILVSACEQAGVARLLQQSIALVNSSGSDAWSDEEAIFESESDDLATRAIAAAIAMEQNVRSAGVEWLILRGGLFYGPGTGFDEGWFARAKAGKLRLPGDGIDFVSLVHIADMAAATARAIDVWPSNQVFIVADNEPVQWRDLFCYVTEIAKASTASPGGTVGFPSNRLRNLRARETLSWAPFYTDYRTGLSR
jgi:nucleoside-diphosphate-sugar epimerase